MNTIGLYLPNIADNIEFISKLKNYFYTSYDDYDFVLFSDIIHNIQFTNLAIIQTYHLRFFQGIIIFPSVKDYLDNQNILSNNIWILIDENTDINQKELSKHQLFTIKNNEIILI